MMPTFLVTPATLMISFTTTIVFAVTAVHEEVHEWTRQEKADKAGFQTGAPGIR